MSAKKKAMGMGIAAAAAAAAGYYFYASKDAAKNRKNAAKWATGFKKDVLAKVKESGVLDAKHVQKAVGEVEKLYKKAKEVDAKDIANAAEELKGHWDALAQEAQKGFKKGMKQAAKTAQKAAKKMGK